VNGKTPRYGRLFTNRITKINEPIIIVDDTSDHLPILAWIDLKPFMINVPTAYFYRRIDLADNQSINQSINLFKQILASTNWDSIETICAANDVSAAYEQFELIVKRPIIQLLPKRRIKRTQKNLNNFV